jgi:glucose/arabinose dehydrogenase
LAYIVGALIANQKVFLNVSTLSIIIIIISLLIPFRGYTSTTYSQQQNQSSTYSSETQQEVGPIVKDPNLKVEKVISGLDLPTSMAFLGPNDFLVLEQLNGTVERVG